MWQRFAEKKIVSSKDRRLTSRQKTIEICTKYIAEKDLSPHALCLLHVVKVLLCDIITFASLLLKIVLFLPQLETLQMSSLIERGCPSLHIHLFFVKICIHVLVINVTYVFYVLIAHPLHQKRRVAI